MSATSKGTALAESAPSSSPSSGAGPEARVVTHFTNHDMILATWECVLLSIWRHDQRPAYAAARGSAGDALAQSRPGPLALFTLVLETGTLPDDPTRAALARVRLQPCFKRVVACAGVAEGAPLRIAALRSVSIDLDQRAPPPFPTRMFDSRVDAAVWIIDRLWQAGEKSIRGTDLLAVINSLTK
jgi:hypothetical protein